MVLVVKSLPASVGNTRDTVLIFGSRRFPGGGNGNPLQCSCLENPMDRGTWQATVHGVAKSWTWMDPVSMHAHEMDTFIMTDCKLYSVMSIGSKNFWKFDICFWQADKSQIQYITGKIRAEILFVCACDGITYYKWKWFRRRKWQSTPVFLPGESHGQRSLAGHSLWGLKESGMTEQLTHTHTHSN